MRIGAISQPENLRMLKAGCVILTTWLVLNLIPSAWIVVTTVFGDGHTPALTSILSPNEVEALSPATLATLDSIAVFANCTNLAFCFLALVVVWRGLHSGRIWAFWALFAGFSLALLGGVAADYVVGFVAPGVNLISAGILFVGLALAAVDLYGRSRGSSSSPHATADPTR